MSSSNTFLTNVFITSPIKDDDQNIPSHAADITVLFATTNELHGRSLYATITNGGSAHLQACLKCISHAPYQQTVATILDSHKDSLADESVTFIIFCFAAAASARYSHGIAMICRVHPIHPARSVLHEYGFSCTLRALAEDRSLYVRVAFPTAALVNRFLNVLQCSYGKNCNDKCVGKTFNPNDDKVSSSSSLTSDKQQKEDNNGRKSYKTGDEGEQYFVGPADRAYLTDFHYLILCQVVRTRYTASSRAVHRKASNVVVPGFSGLKCRHCDRNDKKSTSAQRNHKGVYFPANGKTLQSTVPMLYRHLLKCAFCPNDVRHAIAVLKVMHKDQAAGKRQAFVANPKFSGNYNGGNYSQGCFFSSLWERFHDDQYNGVDAKARQKNESIIRQVVISCQDHPSPHREEENDHDTNKFEDTYIMTSSMKRKPSKIEPRTVTSNNHISSISKPLSGRAKVRKIAPSRDLDSFRNCFIGADNDAIFRVNRDSIYAADRSNVRIASKKHTHLSAKKVGEVRLVIPHSNGNITEYQPKKAASSTLKRANQKFSEPSSSSIKSIGQNINHNEVNSNLNSKPTKQNSFFTEQDDAKLLAGLLKYGEKFNVIWSEFDLTHIPRTLLKDRASTKQFQELLKKAISTKRTTNLATPDTSCETYKWQMADLSERISSSPITDNHQIGEKPNDFKIAESIKKGPPHDDFGMVSPLPFLGFSGFRDSLVLNDQDCNILKKLLFEDYESDEDPEITMRNLSNL